MEVNPDVMSRTTAVSGALVDQDLNLDLGLIGSTNSKQMSWYGLCSAGEKTAAATTNFNFYDCLFYEISYDILSQNYKLEPKGQW